MKRNRIKLFIDLARYNYQPLTISVDESLLYNFKQWVRKNRAALDDVIDDFETIILIETILEGIDDERI